MSISVSHWGMFFGYWTAGYGPGVYSSSATWVACAPEEVGF